MDKVNMWITQQPPDVNICNVQSIDYKVKNGMRESSIKDLYNINLA